MNTPETDLHREVHGDLRAPGPEPVLLLAGFPMGGGGFRGLAERMSADRVVVTYDPRGVGRSVRAEGDDRLLGARDHAADLALLIDSLDVGAVDVFASSGGAVNALALMELAPEKVHLLVAHEPPLTQFLPDREFVERANEDIAATYERDGFGPAMAKFITLVMHDGELDEAYLQRPAPAPAQFGLPATDDGSRDDPLLAGSIRNGPSHQPDQTAIAAAADRILVAIGADSGGGLAARGARSAAEALGLRVVAFPDGHAGFADGEHGQTGSPDEFADRLREVLGPTL
ncbi:alpha/beta hydrolase [Tessaracoccus rhinocerotis]|uniref:Alpha/beta hydrolase n=1 Tax=Tessaracoccus rhinocerotis TaxID=1689449 RepID=A0A553K2T9_9ACTN|nr:alpha/beta hydrolase [Tessaracoccus rhinocerotis]TRY19004.1 alpha/beta hydrolase [Tessaracoccus rhinocerotis]